MRAMANDQIKIIMDRLDRLAEAVIIDLTLEITANLQEDTPVDIGWARANWVPNIGGPANITQVADPAGGDVAAVSAQSAAGQTAMFGYAISDGPVFVSNNVPYIGRLNDGWSAQAPAGFIQMSIARGLRSLQGNENLGRLL